MRPGRASRTAQYAASFRALESVRRPARVRLFEDPLAVHFLDPDLQRIARLASRPVLGRVVRAYVDWRWPGAMTSGIARTRLIDDILRRSLRDGITQIVLLGAGFDCRAIRLPELAERRVVEVDHPATQAAKKARLARILGELPHNVTYVEADFTRQNLGSVLESTALDLGARVFFLWEGVTHYVGEAAVDAALQTLEAKTAPGSLLLFTYIHRGLLDGSVSFDGARESADKVAGDGEPWIWGMDPVRLGPYLSERGFDLEEDWGASDYRAHYWGDRARRMKGFAFYRVALARARGAGALP